MHKFLENVIDVMGFLDEFEKTKDTSIDSENRSAELDLLIVDHPHVSHLSESYYQDIVNTIHHEIKCDMLTLK